jgi:uncharacterized protein (TIRG00374 family)
VDAEHRRDRRAVLVALVVGTPISAVFLWLAFRSADLDEVWSTLTDADPLDVALAIAAMTGVYLLQALRWRAIARARPPSYLRYAEFVVSGVAVNNVLPGRLGDILRARWLAVSSALSSGRALSSVVLDRGADLLALVLLLAISLPRVTDEGGWLVRVSVGAVILVAALLIGLLFARLYTRHRPRNRRKRGLVRRIARDTLEGLADPLPRTTIAEAAVLSVGAWLIWSLAAFLVARALGIELDLLDVLFVTAVVNLGVAVPSSPGFVGTYQWLAVESLAVVGVSREPALAFAVLLHATWYVPTTVVGGGLLVRRGAVAVRGRRRRRRARTSASSSAADPPVDPPGLAGARAGDEAPGVGVERLVDEEG